MLKRQKSHEFDSSLHYGLMIRTPHKILFKVSLDFKIIGFEVFELSAKNLNDVLIRLNLEFYYRLRPDEKKPNVHHIIFFYPDFSDAKHKYDSL